MQPAMTASTSPPNTQPVVTPASLYSLTIYNPTFGATDETIHEQIVFHYSRGDMLEDEKLRQIGLAQGIAEFSKVFSKTENLSSVETEKSRIVLYEVEPNWWILAYIDLTRIQHPDRTEYSNKEVSPPQLLNAQLTTAYEQFRFLYGGFETAFTSLGRGPFCKKLDKFWSKWSWRWEVTLHGNPASDIWGGIRVAQPKIGGSMAEVLDAFVEQEEANGLLDMVVARYGKAESDALKETLKGPENEQNRPSGLSNLIFPPSRASGRVSRTTSPKPTDQYPRQISASDGCVYLGRGRLDATSIRDISNWITNFYTFNDDGSASANAKRRKPRRPRVRLGSSASLLREITTASLGDAGIPTPRSPRTERPTPPMPVIPSDREWVSRERSRFKPSERERERQQKERPIVRLAEREAGRARRLESTTTNSGPRQSSSSSPSTEFGDIPPPIRTRPKSLIPEHRDTPPSEGRERSATIQSGNEGAGPRIQPAPSAYSAGKILDYLTFGWSGGRSRERDRARERDSTSRSPSEHDKSEPPNSEISQERKKGIPHVRFVIGLQGELDNLDDGLDLDEPNTETSNTDGDGATWKITERIVWISHKEQQKRSPSSSKRASQETIISQPECIQIGKQKENNINNDAQATLIHEDSMAHLIQNAPQLQQFRLVVYVNPPFVFALFFRSDSPHLAQPVYYRSLHLRLGPLRGPLVSHEEPEPEDTRRPNYDLFYDPATLRQICSIPNIPPYDPYGCATQVSRLDAINIHSQILFIYGDIDKEKERKSRTARGWWIAWNKLCGGKEAVQVWKSGEAGKGNEITVDAESDTGDGGLFDTKKYFEVLMRTSLRG